MEHRLPEALYNLMKLIWANEPVTSMDLARMAEGKLGWKRTTTYNNLKRLITLGVCENEKTVVRSLVSEREMERFDSTDIGEQARRRFGGSLPRFIATFINEKGMTKEEAKEIADILNKFCDE